MTGKERFLAVIDGKPADRVPVFPLLMSFSANRYGANYRQFASDGSVIAQSQLKVYEMFGLDAITACSDAFRISADLGGEIFFPENKPPHLISPLVRSESDFNCLKKPDVADLTTRMADRAKAVKEMVASVGDRCMVLGWVDMPFAEACSLCGVTEFMMMLYDEPELAHRILEFLTEIVCDFSLLQLEAGAPMIGAGDAAASLISPNLYREFALPYEQMVCGAIHRKGGLVKLHMCGNTTNLLQDLATCGADLINVDHMVDISLAAEIYGKMGKSFKGNLNPVADLLHATPEACIEKALDCIRYAKGTRYMLSAGCEVPAEVSNEVFEAFCRVPKMVSE